MKKQAFTITAEFGIHARPAMKLVQLCMGMKSEMTIEVEGKTANLKSIMGLMSLGIYKGSIVSITAQGDDEIRAIEKMIEFMSLEKLGRTR